MALFRNHYPFFAVGASVGVVVSTRVLLLLTHEYKSDFYMDLTQVVSDLEKE